MQYTAHTPGGSAHVVTVPVRIGAPLPPAAAPALRLRSRPAPPNDSVLRLLKHARITDLLGGKAGGSGHARA